MLHQGLRIAGGQVEEHQVGRRVVEEARQRTRQPEIPGIDRRAVRPGDQAHQAGQLAVAAGAQDGDGRGDGDEDAGEQLADLEHRRPVELVAGAHRLRGDRQGDQRQADQQPIAHQALQLHRGAHDVEAHARFPQPGQQHRADHPGEQQQVPLAVQPERRVRRRVIGQQLVFAGIEVAVDGIEDRQQRRRQQRHRRGHVLDGPQEIDALQKAEEQRRIAQRGQPATGIGDQEDEEHHHVHAVLAVVVGAQQRADQQHRRAGGAHQRGEQGAEGQQAGIEHRRAVQVAPQQDAAGDGVEGQQQDDEGQVLGEQRVHHQRGAVVQAEAERERQQEGQGPGRGDLAEVVVPEAWGKDRQQGDRQQDAGERQRPGQAQGRAVQLGGLRQGRQQQQDGQAGPR
ncbi:hypothetical protein D9M70_386710 [compost metagenome]